LNKIIIFLETYLYDFADPDNYDYKRAKRAVPGQLILHTRLNTEHPNEVNEKLRKTNDKAER